MADNSEHVGSPAHAEQDGRAMAHAPIAHALLSPSTHPLWLHTRPPPAPPLTPLQPSHAIFTPSSHHANDLDTLVRHRPHPHAHKSSSSSSLPVFDLSDNNDNDNDDNGSSTSLARPTPHTSPSSISALSHLSSSPAPIASAAATAPPPNTTTTTAKRKSYTKTINPSSTSSSHTYRHLPSSGLSSSYPSSSPSLPPVPSTSPSGPPTTTTTSSPGLDIVQGEIISVTDEAGHGWKRHTRVYGAAAPCLACAAAASRGMPGGFYGRTVRPEDRGREGLGAWP